MGKTLRRIIFGSMILGSLLLTGCMKNIEKRVSRALTGDENAYAKTVLIEPKQKVIQKSLPRELESYFFEGDELNSVTLSKDNIKYENSNPVIFIRNQDNITELDSHIMGPNNQHEGGEATVFNPNRVLKVGLAKYQIPKIEDYSKVTDLLFEIVEFESERYRNNFIEKTTEAYLLDKVVLARDNMMFVIVEPTIQGALEGLSDEQMTIYRTLIKNYTRRTGTELKLSEDEEENKELLKSLEKYTDEKDSDVYLKALYAVKNPGSAYAEDIRTNKEPESEKEKARIEWEKNASDSNSKYASGVVDKTKKITNRGLENYFFQGKELKDIKLSYTLDDSNPGIVRIEDLDGGDRAQFESSNILGMGIGEYYIPMTEHALRLTYLTLSVIEFKSKRDREDFIKGGNELTYPFFTRDKVLSYIEEPTIDEIIDPFGPFSEEQQSYYFNLIHNYVLRTGMEMQLSENEEENRILEKVILSSN